MAYTGDTRTVPLSHGDIVRGKLGLDPPPLGSVTDAASDEGQLVSAPVGTSEYW